MDDQNIVKRAVIEAVAFSQQEPATDKAFLCADDGKTYRVRRALRVEPQANVTHLKREYDLTVVELGSDGLPVKNHDGSVTVIAATTWIIDSQSLGQDGGLSLEDQQDMIVSNLIYQASKVSSALPGFQALDDVWAADV